MKRLEPQRILHATNAPEYDRIWALRCPYPPTAWQRAPVKPYVKSGAKQ